MSKQITMIEKMMQERQVELQESMQSRQRIPAHRALKQAKLSEGTYIGLIEDIEVEENVPYQNELATRVRLLIQIFNADERDGSVQVVTIPETFYLKPELQNKRYMQRFTTLLGRSPEEGFDSSELVGQRVLVDIEHYQDLEGNVYDNFNSVLIHD